MNVTFCSRCGIEIGPYEQWTVTIWFSNGAAAMGKTTSDRICGDCAAPAIKTVKDSHTGVHRIPRFKERTP